MESLCNEPLSPHLLAYYRHSVKMYLKNKIDPKVSSCQDLGDRKGGQGGADPSHCRMAGRLGGSGVRWWWGYREMKLFIQ